MKKYIILLIISTLSIIAFAHEFWLEPQKFLLQIGEKINFRVFVGENFTGEDVDFSLFKVEKFAHFQSETKKETNGNLTEKNLSDFLVFDKAGNHLIAFNNSNKFIGLEAKEFNEYLESDGLDNVKALRKQRNETNKKSREVYQRCVKTLVQVGGKNDETYKINTGMTLELIPENNPYSTPNSLTFKVLFKNKPLGNALVVVWQKGIEKPNKREFRSDANGKITFDFEQKGVWMVSAVRMIPIKNPKADWQSYWGSYTFGFN